MLLHSRAGDEQEVLPLLEDLDPDERHLGLLPLGPLELTPEGRHWYAIEREASPEPTSFLPTLEALFAWLDHTLAAHGIDPGQAVLAGFSQGAVMTYSLGLAPGRPSPAGFLTFSGYPAGRGVRPRARGPRRAPGLDRAREPRLQRQGRLRA